MKRGGRLYTFTANLNAFYLKLLRTFLCQIDSSMPPYFVFVVDVLYFCFFLSNMNNEIYGRLEIILENDRGRKKSAG